MSVLSRKLKRLHYCLEHLNETSCKSVKMYEPKMQCFSKTLSNVLALCHCP